MLSLALRHLAVPANVLPGADANQITNFGGTCILHDVSAASCTCSRLSMSLCASAP